MSQIQSQQVHFRSAFTLVSSSQKQWGDLPRIVRKWISNRPELNDAFWSAWFFAGGEWKPPGGREFVKTAAFVGTGTDESPQFWSVRFEHPCVEFPDQRLWRTDVGIARVDAGHRVSIVVTHRLRSGFGGSEPPSPVPSAPGLVRRLLTASGWTSFAGSERLPVKPQVLKTGEGTRWRDRLQDPARTCPLILVSRGVGVGPLVDVERLGRLLSGAAIVVEAIGSSLDEELQWLVPQNFRCWGGTVRVYQPRVDLSNPADFRRHRFFSRQLILGDGATAVEDTIIRGIVGRTSRPVGDALTTVEDVGAKERESRVAALQDGAEQGADSTEWVQLLEEDNANLHSRLQDRDHEVAALTEAVDAAGEAKDRATEDRAEAERQASNWKQRALDAESTSREYEDAAGALRDLATLPTDVGAVVDLILRAFPDRIALTARGRKSAEKASLNDAPAELGTLWKCLRAMAVTLHRLHFDSESDVDILNEFHDSTGFDVTLTEAKATKGDQKLMMLRRDVFQGEEIDITAHVKWGNKVPKLLRVHYYPDHVRDLLVIGHCGDHLDTAGTRRRK